MPNTKKYKEAVDAYFAEAQDILDRAIAAGDETVIDIYTREVTIRKSIIARGINSDGSTK